MLQLSDGKNKTVINRDDQAGYRLDTTYTHKGRGVLSKEAEMTRVDYVNAYSSVLQTSSYHIMETKTMPQACVGVVKASFVYPKNPSQHASDLRMLEKHLEFAEQLNNKNSIVSGLMVETTKIRDHMSHSFFGLNVTSQKASFVL